MDWQCCREGCSDGGDLAEGRLRVLRADDGASDLGMYESVLVPICLCLAVEITFYFDVPKLALCDYS